MRYPDVGRLSSYANELRAAVRRRKSARTPRARVRVGHSEPRLLTDDDSRAAEKGDELATPHLGLPGRGPRFIDQEISTFCPCGM